MSTSRSFDHTAHVQHRWRRFLNHDSKKYAGFSVMACGIHFAKAVKAHRKNKGIAFLTRKTVEKIPKLMMYPLVLGISGAELLTWVVSYANHNKNDKASKATRNAKLVPAVFAVFGTTLNSMYPLVGRMHRLRGWFRPIKWGAVGLVVDNVVSRFVTIPSALDNNTSRKE